MFGKNIKIAAIAAFRLLGPWLGQDLSLRSCRPRDPACRARDPHRSCFVTSQGWNMRSLSSHRLFFLFSPPPCLFFLPRAYRSCRVHLHTGSTHAFPFTAPRSESTGSPGRSDRMPGSHLLQHQSCLEICCLITTMTACLPLRLEKAS